MMGRAGLDMAVVAPPKNKKKKWVVSALAINRPPYGVWGIAPEAKLIGPVKAARNDKRRTAVRMRANFHNHQPL